MVVPYIKQIDFFKEREFKDSYITDIVQVIKYESFSEDD